jgi:hypothetical protein
MLAVHGGDHLMPVYDISATQRRIQDLFVGATPPLVQPKQLKLLIAYLEVVTALLEQHAQKVERWLGERGGTSDLWLQFNPAEKEISAWRDRLTVYRAAVDDCPPAEAECTLWSVVAPVFYGYYGGADSKAPQTVPDLMTPFRLANTLSEIVAADTTSNVDAALKALGESLEELPGTAGKLIVGTLRALGEGTGALIGGAAAGIGERVFGEYSKVVAVLGAVGGIGALIWWFTRRKAAT